MRAMCICICLAAGLAGGCTVTAEQKPPNAFAAAPSEGLTRLAADGEAHGEMDTALGLYKQAADVMPNSSAYVRLGEAYARAVQVDRAIGAFRSALELDPDNGDALLGLGSELVRKNALTDAIVILKKAAARDATPEIWNRLGLAQILAGRFAAARDSLERASELSPIDSVILSNLALAEALLGNSERAIELDWQVVRSGVEHQQVRSVVIALILAGRPDDAREIADLNLAHGDADELLNRVAAMRAMRTPEARTQALGRLIG